MPVPDEMSGQQISAAVIVVADAERVGQLPAASVQESHGQPALPERLIELGVRIRQRRLAALDQNARRRIEQQLLQNLALAMDGVFRGVDDNRKALRGKTRLNVLEQRRENVVAERGRDHGDAPVLTGCRRAEKAAAAAPLFDQSVLLQHGQRLPQRLAADGKPRGKLLLARQSPLPVRVPLRQRLPERLHQLLIFRRHTHPPPVSYFRSLRQKCKHLYTWCRGRRLCRPTHWEITNSPKSFVKTVQSAGLFVPPHCTTAARKPHCRICSFSFGDLSDSRKKFRPSADSTEMIQNFFRKFSTLSGENQTGRTPHPAFCRCCTACVSLPRKSRSRKNQT